MTPDQQLKKAVSNGTDETDIILALNAKVAELEAAIATARNGALKEAVVILDKHVSSSHATRRNAILALMTKETP